MPSKTTKAKVVKKTAAKKKTAPKKSAGPNYRHDRKTYNLDVDQVAAISGRGRRWVYTRAGLLGGVKKAWDPSRGVKTIRFPEVGLKAKLKALGLDV